MLIAASGGGSIIGISRMRELPFWAVTKRWKDTLADLGAGACQCRRPHTRQRASAVGEGSNKARSNTLAGTAKYNGN